MTDRIPPTSIVTAYKAYAQATDRAAPASGGGNPDHFGPAVASPSLSSSMQGAMEQAAKATDTPSTYDRHGNPVGGS